MELEVLFITLAVVLAHGAPNETPTDLKCYKKTINTNEDFTCTWKPGASAGNATYTFHYCRFDVQIKNVVCASHAVGRKNVYVLLSDDASTIRESYLLVEAHLGNSSYRSSNVSVCLQHQVQYDAPDITMSRSSGNITLFWQRPPEAIVNEIQYRRRGDQLWESETLETEGEKKEENHTLTLQKDTVYNVRVRRKAKALNIWSAWSQTMEVPVEIREKPMVTWDIGELNTFVRPLKLRWEAPPEPESAGGVRYHLSLAFIPCASDPRIIQTDSTEYNTNVSASAVTVNITAINNVGKSPKQTVIIPAQHLENCPKDKALPVGNQKKRKCVEWYELTGANSTGSVQSNWTKKEIYDISQIKQDMKDFVRYHYFFHIGANEKPRTIALCPIYKTEGVPKHGPPKVTVVDVTHNSALVSWQPIPIAHQQGFLKNYVIYITRGHDTNVVQINGSQTNYTIPNLIAGTLYVVHVAGETVKGVGPSTTGQILLSPPPGVSHSDWIIVAPIVLALILTILCSFIIKRLKSKLLPEIPTPVITETPVNLSRNKEELYPAGEEVHPVLLVHDHQDKSNKPPPPFLEESALLEEPCDTSLCEDEGVESQADWDSDALWVQFPPEPRLQEAEAEPAGAHGAGGAEPPPGRLRAHRDRLQERPGFREHRTSGPSCSGLWK
ncbi:hypothetical protein AAFF_G00257690 [Aldrovandia affinis]|uniref:Fibronectin type-III domain-containing protein n=1 Tax=Aldrovandia affinis TaxID=143900 RepID=A0AAD7STJ6_9TELE|nr:hypothetical protein AAFF_G00257690 [Aldrovandia affinis]